MGTGEKALTALLGALVAALIGALPASAQDARPDAKPEAKPDARPEARPEKPVETPADTEYHTPLAGEAIKTEVLGSTVDVEARDRSSVFAALAGADLQTPRIGDHRSDILLALYYRGFFETRFARATLSGFSNDVEFAQRFEGFEVVARANTYTLPGGRTEVVDDAEVKPDRVKYGRVLGEIGAGYRMGTSPHGVDNELRIDAFYDAAWVYTRRARDTGSGVRLPPDTLEHGLHLRILYDGLRRNILELPHSGFAAGGDLEVLHRDRWGTTVLTTHTYSEEQTRDFVRAQAYAVAATGLPFLSERHRFILALHGGYSPPGSLDRFSEFGLGSGPLATESYDLARAPIPGTLTDQLRVRDYVVGCIEYRFEVLFFAYLHLRWTTTFADHLVTREDQTTHYVRQAGQSLAAAVSSGFFFQSSIYLEYAFATAQLRGRDGHSLLFVLTKAF